MKTLLLLICLAISAAPASGEDGYLQIHVANLQADAIPAVVFSPKGGGGQSPASGSGGRTRVRLPAQTRPGDWVELQVVSPPGVYLFISPYDQRVQVPSFEERPENYVSVVLAKPGDQAILRNGKVLVAITSLLNDATVKAEAKANGAPDPRKALTEVATVFQLKPEEIDLAIRDWGKTVTDPYEVGLFALYERRYGDAERELRRSYQRRLEEADRGRQDLLDAARYLGDTYMLQGQFEQAVQVLKPIAERYPDPKLSFQLAKALQELGAFDESIRLYGELIATLERGGDRESDLLRLSFGELGGTQWMRFQLSPALANIERALQLDIRFFGESDFETAEDLQVRAMILEDLNRFDEAERDFRRALSIAVDANRAFASGRYANNLGLMYWRKGDYVQAERLCRLALEIHAQLLPAGHGELGRDRNNVAILLIAQEKYDEAERLLNEAYEIDRRAYGAEQQETALALANLGALYRRTGRSTEAERALRESLAIRAPLGDHPWVAYAQTELGALLRESGRLQESEAVLRQALQAFERTVGRTFVFAGTADYELGKNLEAQGRFDEAATNLRQAVATLSGVRGLDHPSVRAAVDELARATAAGGASRR